MFKFSRISKTAGVGMIEKEVMSGKIYILILTASFVTRCVGIVARTLGCHPGDPSSNPSTAKAFCKKTCKNFFKNLTKSDLRQI